MAYYYVKTGGTATGDAGRYATQQTGSFATLGAANYYANVNALAAATTPVAPGDFVCVSDLHTEATGAITLVSYAGTLGTDNIGDPITWISVDDTNIDQYKVGTSAQLSSSGSTADVLLTGLNGDNINCCFMGLYFTSTDEIRVLGNSSVRAIDCTFEISSSTDKALSMEAGGIELVNCTLNNNSGSGNWTTSDAGSAVLRFKGCTFASDQLSVVSSAIISQARSGDWLIEDCDFTGSMAPYLVNEGSSTQTTQMRLHFHNCSLPSTLTSFQNGAASGNSRTARTLVTGCATAANAAAAEYQYYLQTGRDYVEDETTVYRGDSSAFASGQRISFKVVTGANTGPGNELWFDLPTRWANLSSASEDTIDVYLMSSSTLTDADVRVEVSYLDGTTSTWNSVINNALNPFDTGTTLTADTSVWNGRVAENRYKISVSTSGDAGADSFPRVRVYVSIPSATIYVCPTVELS